MGRAEGGRSLPVFTLLVAVFALAGNAPSTAAESAPAIDAADNFAWLEASWVSDADASMAANPSWVQSLDAAGFDRFKALLGKLHWRFASGMFSAARPGAVSSPAPYFIRPAGAAEFELIIDERAQSVYRGRRTDTGFCLHPQIAWAPELHEFVAVEEPAFVECFRLQR